MPFSATVDIVPFLASYVVFYTAISISRATGLVEKKLQIGFKVRRIDIFCYHFVWLHFDGAFQAEMLSDRAKDFWVARDPCVIFLRGANAQNVP